MKDKTDEAKWCCRTPPMEQSRPDDSGVKCRIVCLFCGRTSPWAHGRKSAIKEWNDENRTAAEIRRG